MSIKRERNKEGAWVWRFDIRIGGRRVRETGFETRDDCLSAVSSMRADHKRGKYKFPADRSHITINRARETYIEQAHNCSPNYLLRIKTAFTRLGEIIPLERPVTEVTQKHLEKLIDRRVEDKAKAKTILNDLNAIISTFRCAKKQLPELADWTPPARPDGLSASSGRKRIISWEEEKKILARLLPLNPSAADVFIIAMRTGMRLGEIIALKWTDLRTERSPGISSWVADRTRHEDRQSGASNHR